MEIPTKRKKKDDSAKWRSFATRLIRYTALLALILGVFAASYDFAYRYAMKTEADKAVLEEAKDMIVMDGVEIKIDAEDDSTAKVAEKLQAAGFIDNVFAFRLLSKINGYDGRYQAGYHVVSKRMNYNELMFTLTQDPVTVTVMIPEGYSVVQIASLLDEKKVVGEAEFLEYIDKVEENVREIKKAEAEGAEEKPKALLSYDFLADIPDGKDEFLEGFLYPDTYYFTVGSTPKTVLNKLLSNFESKFKHKYAVQMEKLGLDMNQMLTLASLVERESAASGERRTIAGILYKRMKSTDPNLAKLQSCASLQYIFRRDTGEIKEFIYNSDTLIDDPYNTYQNQGLPPGPICNPSIDSILSVLDMEKNTPYWYFCATGKGDSAFATTYSEHMANVKKYGYIRED